MALKDLLVHVIDASNAEPVLGAAFTLARQTAAHVTGLAIQPPLDIPTYAAAQLPVSVTEIFESREKERITAARHLFAEKAKQAGLEGRCDWRTDRGFPNEILGLHARYADLTVVSQQDPECQDKRFDDLAEDLLLTAGRPLLLVPYVGAPDTIGKRVLVAWNASREAARAVADAIPLLDAADSVEVLIAGEQDIGDLPGADIAAHLARHAVDVQVHRTVIDDISVGDGLLNRAAETSADLIVMGGYGRSRFREFVLGGVTRHILQHMTVPVLMSH